LKHRSIDACHRLRWADQRPRRDHDARWVLRGADRRMRRPAGRGSASRGWSRSRPLLSQCPRNHN